jgi:hypothetical protein
MGNSAYLDLTYLNLFSLTQHYLIYQPNTIIHTNRTDSRSLCKGRKSGMICAPCSHWLGAGGGASRGLSTSGEIFLLTHRNTLYVQCIAFPLPHEKSFDI